MVNDIESFFKVEKNYWIYTAFINVEGPIVCGLQQGSNSWVERTKTRLAGNQILFSKITVNLVVNDMLKHPSYYRDDNCLSQIEFPLWKVE